MVFIDSLIEKCAGRSFEIDCFDIEVHQRQDFLPPIFKGPGTISGNSAGRMSFKLHNQLPMSEYLWNFLKELKSETSSDQKYVRLFAKDYDGIEWSGAWSMPTITFFQSEYLIISGKFNQLSTRLQKLKSDNKRNVTELVFAGTLDLPYKGVVHEKSYHGSEELSTRVWHDHHDLDFKGASIAFQESIDRKRTHIVASHRNQFEPPHVETWIMESLDFITARPLRPRMVIRHFQDDALIFIRETPLNTGSNLPPPISRDDDIRDDIWKLFLLYLTECEKNQRFELLDLTMALIEVILASTGTIQGFLITMVLYIENIIQKIFETPQIRTDENNTEFKEDIVNLREYIDHWEGNSNIKERAKGLLSMLNDPSTSMRMDILIKQGVIKHKHKKVWKDARPYLAHGGIVDFSKVDEYWHYQHYFISMLYRLTLMFLGYKGKVLDYDGSKFEFVDFDWKSDTD